MKKATNILMAVTIVMIITFTALLTINTSTAQSDNNAIIEIIAGDPTYCNLTDSCYSQSTITIPQHTSITWTNQNSDDNSKYALRDIISGERDNDTVGDIFTSDPIKPEESFTFTFTSAGVYKYFSVLWPWMTGTIIVEPAEQIPTITETDPIQLSNDTITSDVMIDDDDDTNIICPNNTKLVNGTCVTMSSSDDIENEGGGCLIATAIYGTELAPQVQLLREIRDNTIMSTTHGSTFMTGFNQIYYSFSPTIADIQREHLLFKQTVQVFITPMITTLSLMNFVDGSEESVLLAGITVLLLNGMIYVGMPLSVILYGRHLFIKNNTRLVLDEK